MTNTTTNAVLVQWFSRGVAIFSAGLGGFGVILWVAANWESLGRLGQFALLQTLVLAAGLGATWSHRARAPLGFLAFFGIGALFAYFGQTYQTGADPWQLFALWGALALPMCFGARSDVLWTPWALVAMAAISLWTHTYSGHRWAVEPDLLNVHLLAWSATLALAAMLSPVLSRWTGASAWSFRTAITLSVAAIGLAALGGLFHHPVQPHYPLALGGFALALGVLSTRRWFDVFALSAVALGLDVLLVCGSIRLLMDNGHGDWIGRLMLIGLLAAGLLAVSVSLILRCARRHTPLDPAP